MKKTILSIVILLFTANLSADISFTVSDIGNRNPITSPVEGYDKDSNSYVNPFADDEIQFQINAANFNDYLSYLTDGQVEMFNIHPESFVMNIYPSRRSCAVPQEVLDLTKEGNVQMIADGEGVEGVVGGIPFPNASEPLHHVWNHILRYRGVDNWWCTLLRYKSRWL
jgi:hypothetical protein